MNLSSRVAHESAVNGIEFYFLKYLVGDIHRPVSIQLRNPGRFILKNGFCKFLQFHQDGIDFRYFRISDQNGLCAVHGFNIE